MADQKVTVPSEETLWNRIREGSSEVPFGIMLKLHCRYCNRELTWYTLVPAPNRISYVSSCCGVSYQANVQTVIVDIEDTKIVMMDVCKCGHAKPEHDKDRGCRHREDDPFNDECGCWRFRAQVQASQSEQKISSGVLHD